jgi:hypothetical protein
VNAFDVKFVIALNGPSELALTRAWSKPQQHLSRHLGYWQTTSLKDLCHGFVVATEKI